MSYEQEKIPKGSSELSPCQQRLSSKYVIYEGENIYGADGHV